jgi:GntR family transcriptional regulator, transcriptional repressor for pyruvate dehydrogenase complex
MIQFDAIRTSSAPEMLVQEILKRIKCDELKPGTRLPSQRKLSENFKVGLSTVREAVKSLHVMGYLDVIQGKGTFISENIPQTNQSPSGLEGILEAVSLHDLMQAREIIECEAVKLAAKTADIEQMNMLERKLKQMVQHVEANKENSDKALEIYHPDFEFHLSIAEISNNQAMYEIIKLLVEKIQNNHTRFMSETLRNQTKENIQKAFETLQQVYFWITQRDGEKAARAMRDHLNIVNFELDKEFFNR